MKLLIFHTMVVSEDFLIVVVVVLVADGSVLLIAFRILFHH